MLWYWVIFFSLVFFAFMEQFCNLSKKIAERICMVYTLLFIFLGTIRWDMTIGDWQGYFRIFNLENITSFEQIFKINYWPFEPGYYLAMRFIKYLTGSYTVMLFFMAAVAIGCFYKAAVYFNEKICGDSASVSNGSSIIIAVYLAFWATSCASIFTVRTNMATAICICSLKYVEQRKTWKFFAMVMLATMFHFVAILFLIVYPVYYKRFNFKHIILIIIITCVVFTVGIQRIVPLAGLLGGRYARKIASYNVNRSGEDLSYFNYSTLFLTVRAIANTALILMICFYIKRYKKSDTRYNGLFNIFILGAIVQALTIGFNMQLARAAVFFSWAQYFMLPYIFKLSWKGYNKIWYFGGYVSFMAAKMYFLLGSSPDYSNFLTIIH